MMPYESEPDGDVFAPHHYHIGLAGAFAVAASTNAVVTTVFATAGLLSIVTCWRAVAYPRTGAILSGVALSVTAVAAAVETSGAMTVVLLLSTAIAADDWYSHATGRWSPLDAVWKRFIWPRVVQPIEETNT